MEVVEGWTVCLSDVLSCMDFVRPVVFAVCGRAPFILCV